MKSKGLMDFAFLKERGMGNIYIIFLVRVEELSRLYAVLCVAYDLSFA